LVLVVGALVWRSSVSNLRKTVAARVDGGTGGALPSLDGRDAGDGWLDEPPLMALLAQDSGTGLEGDAGGALPSTAPKTVRFGVILVQYRGAQGASPTARSKGEALALARSIADAAKLDFKASVSKGDPGSTDDAGRMPRGVLEPTAEYVLFTLDRGGVSDPIDTPRGLWIVKRNE
jgi:parvulin-like peptidyl-prolyl isomerase